MPITKKIFSACICNGTTTSCNIDPSTIAATNCYSNKTKCLCLSSECCLKAGAEQMKPGFETATDDMHCKLTLPCCFCGIQKVPTICIDGEANLLCCEVDAALMPTDKKPLACGCCFVACVLQDGVQIKVFQSLDEKGTAVAAPVTADMSRA